MEKVTILPSTATGRPDVAPLDEAFDYDKLTGDIEEVLSELGHQYAPRMAEWCERIDARPKTQADLASHAPLPSWGDWPRPPRSMAPALLGQVPSRSLALSCLRAR